MLAGKYWECQRLEFKIAGTGAGINNGTGYAYSGELSSFFCANALSTALGLSIGLVSRENPFPGSGPSGNWEVVHSGIISVTTSGTGFNGSLSGSIEIDDYVIYNEPGTWTMKWSAVRAYANGSLVASSGAGSYTSARFAPDAVYPHGIPPFIEGGAAVGATPPVNNNCPPGTPPSGSLGEGTCTITGGWRFRDMNGNWQTPTVTMPPGWAPPFTVNATTTWNAQIEGLARVPGNGDYITESGFIWLIPNNPREVVRMNNTDYEAMVLRLASPSRTFFSTDITTDYCPDPTDPTVTDNSTSTVVTPSRSQLLTVVTNASNAIEDNLNDHCYAGASWSRYFQDFSLPGTISTGQSLGGAANGSGALNHTDQYARAANFHGSPHWLYALWFPPDSSSPSVRWAINGTPANLGDYWYPVRQQWVYHPSVLVSTDRRVDVIAEGVDQSAITNVSTIVTALPNFWGLQEFIADTTTWQTAVQLNDLTNSRWTFNGTGTRQVTASKFEFSADSTVAEFDLSSYTVFPYMVSTLARNVALSAANWSNVTSVKIEVEDATGKVTELVAAATTSGNWDIPAELSTKWHTSLAQNLGDSGFLVDTYDDVAPAADDYSSTITASGELAPTQHGSKARSFGILRVTITKTNPGASATLGLITLNLAPRNEWHVRYESGHGATVLSEKGPLFRTQTLWFRNALSDTLLSTPLAKPELVDAPTIGDWLSFRRAFLEGRDAQDAILPEGLTYFVNNEEMTIAKHLWRDPSQVLNGHSFLVQGDSGPVPCLVNGYRQVPAMAITPRRKRSKSNDWQELGALGQYSYSLIANRRNIITTEVADIRLDFPGDVLTPEVSPPDGWEVEYHTAAVTNSEGYDASLFVGSTEYLKMRPWRGGLVFPYDNSTDLIIEGWHICRASDGMIWGVINRPNSIDFIYTNFKDIEQTGTVLSINNVKDCQVSWNTVNKVVVCYVTEGDEVFFTESSDNGSSWTTPIRIADGKNVACTSHPLDDIDAVLINTTDGVWALYTRNQTQFWQPISNFNNENGRAAIEFTNEKHYRLITVISGTSNFRWEYSLSDETWQKTPSGSIFNGKQVAFCLDSKSLSEHAIVWEDPNYNVYSRYEGETNFTFQETISSSSTEKKFGIEVPLTGYERIVSIGEESSTQKFSSMNNADSWGKDQ